MLIITGHVGGVEKESINKWRNNVNLPKKRTRHLIQRINDVEIVRGEEHGLHGPCFAMRNERLRGSGKLHYPTDLES